MIIEFVYSIQILFLIWCLYMVHRSRHAINGMSRGLKLLLALLIVRRIDDAFGILNSLETLILSSAVVIVVTFDVYKIYKEREIYALYLLNRKKRMEKLDRMSLNDEPLKVN